MSQTEFSRVAKCSVSTIQAIELNRLKLSESLAIKIEIATGISRHWLLENDLSAPPVTPERQPYTFQSYEWHIAAKHDFTQGGLAILKKANLPGLLFSSYEVMRAAMTRAIQDGQQDLALYRLTQFVRAFRKEFTGEDCLYVPLYNDDTISLIENDLQTTKDHIKVRNTPVGILGELTTELYVPKAKKAAKQK